MPLLLAGLGLSSALALSAEEVPKQVYLIVDQRHLVASNAHTSRFDVFTLKGGESLQLQAEGDAVIVVVTNQRIIAYGVVGGWRTIDRMASEKIERIDAQDFAGLVVTNKRLLNFSGQSGVWGEQKRAVKR